jgi:hypothetical protein
MAKQYAHVKASGALREIVHVIPNFEGAGNGYVLRSTKEDRARGLLLEEVVSEQLLDLLPEGSVSEEVARSLCLPFYDKQQQW